MSGEYRVLVAVDGERYEIARSDRDTAGRIRETLEGVVMGCSLPGEVWLEPAGDRVEHGVPTVHVRPQQVWHSPAHIGADVGGSYALLAALIDAIWGRPSVASVFAADGEGYDLHVTVSDPDAAPPDGGFDVWRLPYSDPIAGGHDTTSENHHVLAVLDAYSAIGPEGRLDLPDRLSVALEALRCAVHGPLFGDDDPRLDAP